MATEAMSRRGGSDKFVRDQQEGWKFESTGDGTRAPATLDSTSVFQSMKRMSHAVTLLQLKAEDGASLTKRNLEFEGAHATV